MNAKLEIDTHEGAGTVARLMIPAARMVAP
jgi:hypothetical protein